jgi:hypothetical protein
MKNSLSIFEVPDRDENETTRQLARAFDCAQSDAWRLYVLYRIASAKLIDMWLAEKMTWRALWRMATNNPFDNIAQELASLEPKKQRLKRKKRSAPLD